MTDWVRLWHDMPTDPKWRVIARKSGQPLACVIAVFNLMMINASQNAEERGLMVGWDDEDAGAALDMDGEDIAAIREAMQNKVLEGSRLTGWDRRQPRREDNSSGRVKAHREKKAAERNDQQRPDDGVKRDVTHGNAPETDADADADKKPSDEGSGKSAEAELPLGGGGEPGKTEEPGLKPQHIADEWNNLAARLGKPKVRDLTPERRELLRHRIGQYPLDDFLTVFGKIERSAFLRGDKGRSPCTFDWAFKKANFQKILEGNYDQ